MLEVRLADDAAVAVGGAERVRGLVRVEGSDRQPAHRGLPGDGGAHRAESDDGKVDLLVWHRAAS